MAAKRFPHGKCFHAGVFCFNLVQYFGIILANRFDGIKMVAGTIAVAEPSRVVGHHRDPCFRQRTVHDIGVPGMKSGATVLKDDGSLRRRSGNQRRTANFTHLVVDSVNSSGRPKMG